MNTTFITELNYEQVDVLTKNDSLFFVDGEEHTYFNVKIYWGLKFYQGMQDIDITPFVDKIEVTSGDGVSDYGKIIVKHDFINITFPQAGQYNKDAWKVKMNFLRDDERIAYRWHILIKPKFVAIDLDKKIVEVIFNG